MSQILQVIAVYNCNKVFKCRISGHFIQQCCLPYASLHLFQCLFFHTVHLFFLDFLPIFLMPVNLTSDLYFALAPKINTTLMFNRAGIYRMICLAGDFAGFWSRIFSSEYLGIPYHHLKIALVLAKRLKYGFCKKLL